MNNVNDYLSLAEKTLNRLDSNVWSKEADQLIATAQVYATMALAAATRDS